MVEFVNRVFTGLVSISVIVAVLGSLVRTPRRRDLVWLSWGLVGGRVRAGGARRPHRALRAEARLRDGALPRVDRAADQRDRALPAGRHPRRRHGRPNTRIVSDRVVGLGRALLVLAALVLVTGTVVTGAGPHSGGGKSDEITRIDIPIPDVARVHGTTVMVFLGAVLLTVFVAST